MAGRKEQIMCRDKQIEKMAEAMHDGCSIVKATNQCRGEDCLDCGAVTLYDKGYRKASDVAREIFEEIEELLNLQAKIVCETRDKYRETDEPMLSFIAMLDGRIYSLRVVEEHIDELKKKYTESEDTE